MREGNVERGEIAIDLDGTPHVLRPSFEAVIAIERATGRSLEQLAAQAGASALSIDDAAIVTTECIRAHGRATSDKLLVNYQPEQVAACIVAAGKMLIVRRLELLLYMAITGGYDAQGNLKAPPPTPATDGADTAA